MNKMFTLKISMMAVCMAGLLLFPSCEKDNGWEKTNESTLQEQNPEGSFVATFRADVYEPISRAAVTGDDERVQSLRYLVYRMDQNGNYIYWDNEENGKYLFGASGKAEQTPHWPYTDFSLTLPNGTYKVVFLGNVNEKQFTDQQTPLLTGLESGKYEDVRINFPTAYGFSEQANNLFYWANVEVSTQQPNASVLLQRVVSKFSMSRETIASANNETVRQQLVTTLVNNIFNYLETSDQPVSELISGELGKILKPTLETLKINYLEQMLVAPILKGVVASIDSTMLVQALTSSVDGVLKMNEEKDLLDLNALLNPWNSEADYALVSYNQFPKTLSLDNVPMEFYEPDADGVVPCFAYELNTLPATENEGTKKWLDIYGFKSPWNIRRIDAGSDKEGLISGTLIDNSLVDGILLPGSLHDADANLEALNFESNKRYHAVYSAASLNLYAKDYTSSGQQPGEGNLTLTLDLSNVLNLDQILTNIEEDNTYKMNKEFNAEFDNFRKDPSLIGIVGGLLGGLDWILGNLLGKTVGSVLTQVVYPTLEQAGLGGREGLINKLTNALTPEGGIQIELPLNVSALNTDNLQVSGGWSRIDEGPLPDMQ